MNQVAVLQRILECGWNIANKILNGERPMTEHQQELLEEYNSNASEEFRIEVPGRN